MYGDPMKLFAHLGTYALVLALCACSGNPFAPKKHTPEDDTDLPPAPDAISPVQAMDNLARAMRDRDKDLYETLLDQNFWFTETDCLGDLVLANGFEEELEIMGGSRDGSQPGIFDIFRTFEFDFELIRRSQELGPEYPSNPDNPNDPDAHPDEDWEVFRGRVESGQPALRIFGRVPAGLCRPPGRHATANLATVSEIGPGAEPIPIRL